MVHQLCQVRNTSFTVLSKIDGVYTFKTPVLSKLREYCRRGGKKTGRARGQKSAMRSCYLEMIRKLTFMISQQLNRLKQDLDSDKIHRRNKEEGVAFTGFLT